jgi:AcrR family transcriptional regulator
MEEIAERAGVTKPVVYQHFPSKRALYLELLQETTREVTEQVAQATTEATTGREQVERGFAAYFSYAADHPEAFRLLFGSSVRDDAEFASFTAQVVDGVAELIGSLIEIDGPPEQRRALAHAIFGMAEATSRRVALRGEVQDPQLLARWLAEMAWFGLRGVRAD